MVAKWAQAVIFLVFSYSAVCAQENTKITQATLEAIAEQAAEKTAKKVAKKLLLSTTTVTEKGLAAEESAQQLPDKEIKTKILRMGSGAVGGNYFVLGELVGGVISHPLGSLPCGHGGTCGVSNLQSQNVTSAGSVANLTALMKGSNQTGFVQSDIAYWAYTGTGLFENKEKLENIRAIASLYPEAMHIVVRKAANIKSINDLKDKKVSVGARKSGTLHGARLVLDAYKLTEDDMESEYLNSSDSIKKLLANELDAVFFTVGTPAPTFQQLFEENNDYTLLSIGKSEQQSIFKKGHYFSPYTIKTNTYHNIPKTDTISVYALWLTTDKTDEKLVYELTKSLWGDAAKQLYNSSTIGRQIDVENSLKGIGIPLHSGAKKYYNEIGKRF